MIKVLKLQKAIYAIVLGVIALVISLILNNRESEYSSLALGFSGGFFILGALLFLYPIFFAKKVAQDESNVELQPIAKTSSDEETVS